jgi:hypothetical protein
MPDPRKSAAAGPLELPAGRNLDKAVHHALGLPPLCKHTRDAAHPRKCSKCGLNVAHWERISPPLPYNTDIAAAMTAWQAVAPERWLIAYDDNYHVRETACVNHDANRGESIYHGKPIASGDTLPLALCHAILALKACDHR